MMLKRKGKLIRVSCWGPIAFGEQYKSVWEDVQLSWTGKPGRTKYNIAPCLVSSTDLEGTLKMTYKLKKENPDINWDTDIEELESATKNISFGKIFINNPKDVLTNIYTPKEYINRKEANKMIAELMKYYNFDKLRIKWNRQKTMIIPI